jgi:hypothetical protein
VREAVGEGVQQRDAHRATVRDVPAEAAPLAEQLLAPVTQRAADHSGPRDERGLEVGAREPRHGEAVHGLRLDGHAGDGLTVPR